MSLALDPASAASLMCSRCLAQDAIVGLLCSGRPQKVVRAKKTCMKTGANLCARARFCFVSRETPGSRLTTCCGQRGLARRLQKDGSYQLTNLGRRFFKDKYSQYVAHIRAVIRGTRRSGRKAGKPYERKDWLPANILGGRLSRQPDCCADPPQRDGADTAACGCGGRGADPPMWAIENPQTELLKSRPFMLRLPYVDVTYGTPCRKQTRTRSCCFPTSLGPRCAALRPPSVFPGCATVARFAEPAAWPPSLVHKRGQSRKLLYAIPAELCKEKEATCGPHEHPRLILIFVGLPARVQTTKFERSNSKTESRAASPGDMEFSGRHVP